MTMLHENIVGIDSAIFMHPTIWKASGHVDAFNDPLIDNRDSKKRYRADVLIEDQIAKYDEKIQKEVEKARKRFGDSFDEAKYLETSERVKETKEKRDALHARYAAAMQGPDLDELKQIILDEHIGTIALLRVAVVDEGIIESIHVTRSLPYRRVHENGRVDTHDVLVQHRHSFPPILLNVILQLHTVLTVVIHGS